MSESPADGRFNLTRAFWRVSKYTPGLLWPALVLLACLACVIGALLLPPAVADKYVWSHHD